MPDDRPDPDELLERVQAEERKEKRGRLTVFFGAAPGVGKTFAMLSEASYQRDVESREVVVGIVETHGRFDTATLLAGFEQLPRRKVAYRGTELEEFDLDGALARRPGLLMVDELAHTNAEGSRHPKRWQDVEELLDAGIDVYTTLNVQHVESLNDVVAQITGVVVRETVPDSVIDAAHEVKLIDLPPDDLLERLREGKVYVPAQAERAIESFFRKGNLIALRELALRRTAERVDAEMLAYRRAHGIEKTWAATDRLLVCLSPSPYSANLLRTARRTASGLHAEWYAVNVETPLTLRLPRADRERMSRHLGLAEQLGAETVTLTGQSAAEEVLRFARERNVTKIVVGKPRGAPLLSRFRKGFVDELVLGSGDIDIFVTTGQPEKAEAPPVERDAQRPIDWGRYVFAVTVTVVATVAAFAVFGREQLTDVVMTFLLGIVVISIRSGFGPSLLGAVLSVLSFDFFFVPPYLRFTIADLRYGITFAVMLLVAVVIAGLTARVKGQAEVARRSERRTAVLYAMSRELSRIRDRDELIQAATRHVEASLDCPVAVYARDPGGNVTLAHHSAGFQVPGDKEQGVVRWVLEHRREAGTGTSTLAGSPGLYLPLAASGAAPRALGVLVVYPRDSQRPGDPEWRRMADALAAQLAMGIERTRLAEDAEHARVEVESERLRSTLLSSVSHDFRTPLAVMKGSASMLVDDDATLTQAARRDLAQALLEETERLDRLVRDLLDMTRLESGGVHLKKDWQSVEEVVGSALNRTELRLRGRTVTTRVPGDLFAPFDGVLVEQVFVNLLENAAKYTPQGTPIEISAERSNGEVGFSVADRGAGISGSERERIFEKFHRGETERTKGGVGLGLTICRAIVRAHGGRIWVEDREGGGALFKFTLPVQGDPPGASLPEIEESEHRAGEAT